MSKIYDAFSKLGRDNPLADDGAPDKAPDRTEPPPADRRPTPPLPIEPGPADAPEEKAPRATADQPEDRARILRAVSNDQDGPRPAGPAGETAPPDGGGDLGDLIGLEPLPRTEDQPIHRPSPREMSSLGDLIGLEPAPSPPRPPLTWRPPRAKRHPTRQWGGDTPVLWMLDPESQPGLTENFRAIKSTLVNLMQKEGLSAFVMTGPDRKVGVSVMVFNTALVLAWDLADKRTLIIDANLTWPAVPRSFGIPEEPGLLNYLLDHRSLTASTHEGPLANLDLMPLGKIDEAAVSPFDLVRFDTLLEEAKQTYDYILIDTAPALRSSQTRTVAAKADGVIIIARANQTRWEVALELKRVLEADGGRLLGSVLNKRQFVIPRSLYRFL